MKVLIQIAAQLADAVFIRMGLIAVTVRLSCLTDDHFADRTSNSCYLRAIHPVRFRMIIIIVGNFALIDL